MVNKQSKKQSQETDREITLRNIEYNIGKYHVGEITAKEALSHIRSSILYGIINEEFHMIRNNKSP